MRAGKRLSRIIGRLHRDEQGADMVEYILMIAAVALPLLAVIIWFRDEIWDMVRSSWQNIKGDAEMETG